MFIVVLSLVQRRSLVLPRVPIAQLHCSPILAKSKKSKNNSSNSSPSSNTNQTPSPSSIPSQSRLPGNESTEPSALEGTSSAESAPPDGLSSSFSPTATPVPAAGSASSTPPAPPTPPDDTNPIYDEQYKAYRGKQTAGPFTWKAAALFLLTGTGLVIYFRTREGTDGEITYILTYIMLTSGVAEENKSMGTPRVGGPYSLIDHNGNKVSQDTYAGKHTLVRTSYDRSNKRYTLDSLDVLIFVLKNWIKWLEFWILLMVRVELQ